MKLLFFISSMRSGGAERVMSLIVNELIIRGHSVTLVVMSGNDNFYDLDPSISIRYFDFKKGKNITQKLTNRVRMFSFIRNVSKEVNPDVIISFIYQMNTNVLLSTRFLGIPVIVSEHNTLDRDMNLSEKIQRFYVSRLADKITILTKHDYEFLGKKLKKKVVMYNPISFVPIESYNCEREKVILAVGSVNRYKHKGFDNLIDIWSEIGDLFPDWKLKIVGGYDESNLNYLKSLENYRKTNNKIEFLGQVKDVSVLLRNASIFVLSSRWEGFPMVLLEAMSQGCTCVSYDVVSGPKEIITHDRDGILVRNQVKSDMVDSLISLMQEQKKRQCLSENAIKSIKVFSVEETVDRWENIFQEVIKR